MKTLEQKYADTQNYVAKSAQHLFVVNENIFLKPIFFEREGDKFIGKLIITNGEAHIQTRTCWTAMKWTIQDYLFPSYMKTKSIPYFKQMREIVSLVQEKISPVDNTELIKEINMLVKELKPFKEEV